MRIELATSSLPRKCSTTELQQQEWILSIYSDFTLHYGAEDGTQTRDPQLGRLMLYQLSYSRIIFKAYKVNEFNAKKLNNNCLKKDSFGFMQTRLYSNTDYAYIQTLKANLINEKPIFISIQ